MTTLDEFFHPLLPALTRRSEPEPEVVKIGKFSPGWYIKLVTGEMEGTFISKERAQQYIDDKLKSGGVAYKGAVPVLVE